MSQAPFDFIALNEKIASPEEAVVTAIEAGELLSHPLADGLSGSIRVTLEFDGPFLIAGEMKPAKGNVPAQAEPLLVDEQPVIPGATLRGLVRSTLEIAAMGRLEQVDRHKRFGIRDFLHPLFKDENRAEVKAGWLYPPEKQTLAAQDDVPPRGIRLVPCPIYRIRIRDLPKVNQDGGRHLDWLASKTLVDRYGDVEMRGADEFAIDFTKTFQFEFVDEARGRIRPSRSGSVTGTYVFSDNLPSLRSSAKDLARTNTIATLDAEDNEEKKKQMKKYEHVFGPEGSLELPIGPKVWKRFLEMNSSPSLTKPDPQGNWKTLKKIFEKEKRIPVFWIGSEDHPDDIEIGLVRVFKRAHRYSVGDKIPSAHRVLDDTPLDFVSALFGTVRKADDDTETWALKSRVAFGFAHIHDGCWTTQRFPTTIQSQPKGSFGPLYLSGMPEKDWSAERSLIAGRKRPKAFSGDMDAVRALVGAPDGTTILTQDESKRKVQTDLTFLVPLQDSKLRFTSEIRLHNVTASEVGGLIWVLTLGGDPALRHAIGRAKGQGAGQARVTCLHLDIERNDGAAIDPTAPEAAGYFGISGSGAKTFLDAFAKEMRRTEALWPDISPVQELLGQSFPTTGDQRPRHYMSVDAYMALRKNLGKKGFPNPPRLLVPPKRSAVFR